MTIADRIFTSAPGCIVGDQRMRSVRSFNSSSISCFVRRVAMAMISATSRGFSEHIVHIRFMAPSVSLSSIARSRSSNRRLISARRPSCKGYRYSVSVLPSWVSISKDSGFSVIVSSARCSMNLSISFVMVIRYLIPPRSRSVMQVVNFPAGWVATGLLPAPLRRCMPEWKLRPTTCRLRPARAPLLKR